MKTALALAAVFAAGSSFAIGSSTAFSASRSDLTAHPKAASMVIRGSVATANDLARQLGRLGLATRLAIGLGRRAIDASLGFDSTSASQWRARGIGVTRPISISLALDASAHEAAYRRLFASDGGAAATPVVWQIRAVIPVVDSKLANAFVSTLMLSVVRSGSGNGRTTTAVSVREAPGMLIVDLQYAAFGGEHTQLAFHRIAPPRVGSSRPRRRGFSALRRRDSVGLWTRSSAVANVGRALLRERHAREIAGDSERQSRGPLSSAPECAALGDSANNVFASAALHLRPQRAGVAAELVYRGERSLLTAAFARRDNGIDIHRRRGAESWMVLWLATSKGLQALPRSLALSSWPRALFLARQCARHESLAAKLFAWPLLAGLFADELETVGPRAKQTVAGYAGVGVGIAHWRKNPLMSVGAIVAPSSAETARLASSLFDKVFGARRSADSVVRWGQGRIRPFVSTKLLGATLGGVDGERWLVGAERGKRPNWLKGNEIAAAQIAPRRTLATLASWHSTLALVADADRIGLRMLLRGDRLVLRAVFERK